MGKNAYRSKVSMCKDDGGTLVVFCGLPGTLKTYLSRHLQAEFGWAYFPTSAFGSLSTTLSPERQMEVRRRRYGLLADALRGLGRLGASCVVDGGFLNSQDRRLLFDKVDNVSRVIVHYVATHNLRKRRLRLRARDDRDPESNSAKSILAMSDLDSVYEDPRRDIQCGQADAVITIDTGLGKCDVTGQLAGSLGERISQSLRVGLERHRRQPLPGDFMVSISEHFETLAGSYDDSTQWRQDETLISQVFRVLPHNPSRILDVGAGTGLASGRYIQAGHTVVGIDLSPVALSHATNRLSVAVLGSAMALPFPDEHFDAVVMRQCLHYTEPDMALAEALRALRSGGMLGVSSTVVASERARSFWSEFKGATQAMRLEVFTEDSLLSLIKETGFTVTEVLRHIIQRDEPVCALEARSPEPIGGWPAFWDMCTHVAARLSPESCLSVADGILRYQQYWTTAWAVK